MLTEDPGMYKYIMHIPRIPGRILVDPPHQQASSFITHEGSFGRGGTDCSERPTETSLTRTSLTTAVRNSSNIMPLYPGADEI